MRRVLVFLLLGPLAVAIAVTMAINPPGSVTADIVGLTAAAVFFLTLPISMVIGVIDTALTHRYPAEQRAGLIAAAGAIIPCLLIDVFTHGAVTASFLLPFAICGAACAGLSALLADGSDPQQPAKGYAAALEARSTSADCFAIPGVAVAHSER